MGLGSKVRIVSGAHKDLTGKIVAISKQSNSNLGMDASTAEDGEIDPETYVSIELKLNETIV